MGENERITKTSDAGSPIFVDQDVCLGHEWYMNYVIQMYRMEAYHPEVFVDNAQVMHPVQVSCYPHQLPPKKLDITGRGSGEEQVPLSPSLHSVDSSGAV